jgi:DNA-binding transcriptional LysR family regulator
MKDIFDPETSVEKVTIACNDYLSSICTQAWLDAITPHAPLMGSSWRPLDVSVIDALVSGQIDLAIVPKAAQANISQTAALQDMVIKPLLNDTFVVFGASSHAALIGDSLSLESFAAHDQVLVSPYGQGGGFIDKTLAEHNLKRRIVHRTSSFNHAADLAIATGSLTVIPERLAKVKSKGVFRPVPFKSENLSSDIIWHASRTRDKAHTWVRHQLQIFFKSTNH